MTAPRRLRTGGQARAERTRTAAIDETVRCILEEGFAPPSVRDITDRAGVTWGVVQYYFGNLIWNTLRGIVVAQMTWPESVDQTRDLQTLVDVVSTYIELRR